MTKVYPNTTTAASSEVAPKPVSDGQHVTALTVWKKSLLFNCSGFTVFDSKGNLVFRVDNYVSGNKGEIVLMDAAGRPLLSIRRKRLSLGDNWLVFDGETGANPRFSVKKRVNLLNSRSLVHVSRSCGTSTSNSNGASTAKNVIYEIEGSYAQRCCVVFDEKRRCVAEIKLKDAVRGVALGVDVFRLVVQPELDPAVAMALVILLDQMFGSRRFSGFF